MESRGCGPAVQGGLLYGEAVKRSGGPLPRAMYQCIAQTWVVVVLAGTHSTARSAPREPRLTQLLPLPPPARGALKRPRPFGCKQAVQAGAAHAVYYSKLQARHAGCYPAAQTWPLSCLGAPWRGRMRPAAELETCRQPAVGCSVFIVRDSGTSGGQSTELQHRAAR